MPKARAKDRGYYPIRAGGPCDIVEAGQIFEVVPGHEKGKWFEVLPEPKAKPKVEKEPAKTGDDGSLT
jgi:hypothetical protein